MTYNQLPVSIGLDLSRPEHRAALLVFIDALDTFADINGLEDIYESFDPCSDSKCCSQSDLVPPEVVLQD